MSAEPSEPTVEPSIEPSEQDVEVVPARRTIVTALPLKRAARDRLAELLDARVVDVREPVDDPDLVLTPACSPQLIGALSDRYGGARIVVVELDDWEFDVDLGGPVKRVLRSGAAAYVLADSIDELAAKIASPATGAPTTPAELTASPTVDDLVTALLADSADASAHRRADPG